MPRKHKGIIQKGINKGKLKKGYKYIGKKTKTGLPIKKSKKKSKKKKNRYRSIKFKTQKGGSTMVKIDQIEIIGEENKKKMVNTIRKLVKIFEKFNIEYMAEGGTLLGLIRHKGLIPWDDDIDLSVPEKYSDIFIKEEFINELKKNNLGIAKHWVGYKIFPLDGINIFYSDNKSIRNYKWPFVDVLFSNNSNGKIKLNVWPSSMFLEKDVYPLKKYKFEDFEIYGPNRPEPYLNNMYGGDWNKIGKKICYSHIKEKVIAGCTPKTIEL